MARHPRRLPFLVAAATAVAAASLTAQVPETGTGQPATRAGVTVPTAASPTTQGNQRPPDSELAFPVYPSAVYLRVYDAGRGQKYYLFGSTVPFTDMVTYYRNVLGEKGNMVFDVPPTYMFEMGRFREETMAFPPGVTIKDYTFSGSAGYPNPQSGAAPERFPTIIQIVPPPATP